jgi:hypothetical protein
MWMEEFSVKKKTMLRLVVMAVAASYCTSVASYGAARPGERREPGGGGGGGQQAQQEASRRAQEEAVRGREEQARSAQQEGIRQQRQSQQDSMRQMEREQQGQQREQRNPAEEQRREQEAMGSQQQRQQENFANQQKRDQERFSQQEHRSQEDFRTQQFSVGGENKPVLQRQFEPRPMTAPRISSGKAVSMPILHSNASPQEVAHSHQVEANLRQHLMPVATNQVPGNWASTREQVLGNYGNNYQFMLNNQMLRINRENTFFNAVPSYEYPAWWQPTNGWVFSDGFTLGNSLNVGLDWLRWGWHPYYGPPPDGFVCAADYMPTPWIYVPAYGLWRLAGSNAWAPGGPPYNYGGPITVEVLEPRHVRVTDPYTNLVTTNVVNVPYFYNAFFNPEADRWLYTNRHGYPVYLNL